MAVMVNNNVHPTTSTPTSPDTNVRANEATRTYTFTPRHTPAPLSTVDAPAHTAPTVFPDVLIAAQQTATVDNVRTSDPRAPFSNLDLGRVVLAKQAYLSAGAANAQTSTSKDDDATVLNADQEPVDIHI